MSKGKYKVHIEMDFEVKGEFDSRCDVEHAAVFEITDVCNEAENLDDWCEKLGAKIGFGGKK